MRTRISVWIAVLCLILVLAGCGQKPPAESSGAASVSEQATKVVGAVPYGFVTVPEDWKEADNMADEVDVDQIRFSSADENSIISMGVWPAYEGSVDAFIHNWVEVLGAENVTNSIGALNRVQAPQIQASYPNGQAIVIWVFRDKEDVLHQVSVEGYKDTIGEAVQFLESSYTLKQEF